MKNKNLIRNIGANYVGAVFSTLMPFIVLPIYLRKLGPDNWGLVSFVSLFINILSLLEIGFAQALVRMFSGRERSEAGGGRLLSNMLWSYERIYVGFALFLCLATLPFAGFIASHWLKLGGISKSDGIFTVCCSSISFLVQFPGSIYRTVLVARQEQVKLNKIQISMLLLRNVVNVAIVLVWPSIRAFLVWQIVSAAAETVITSMYAWRQMPFARRKSAWDQAAVKATLKFSGLMAVSVLLGAATGMIDKTYISAKLPIADLGYYGIASSLALGVLRLSYPVFTAVLPRLASEQDDEYGNMLVNLKLLGLIIAALSISAVLYYCFGRTLLLWWLKSESTLQAIHALLTTLLCAYGLNVIYNLAYTNWVAAGKSNGILGINVVSFIVGLAVAPWSISHYGLLGAGVADIVINSIGAVASIVWLVSRYSRFRRQRQTRIAA